MESRALLLALLGFGVAGYLAYQLAKGQGAGQPPFGLGGLEQDALCRVARASAAGTTRPMWAGPPLCPWCPSGEVTDAGRLDRGGGGGGGGRGLRGLCPGPAGEGGSPRAGSLPEASPRLIGSARRCWSRARTDLLLPPPAIVKVGVG